MIVPILRLIAQQAAYLKVKLADSKVHLMFISNRFQIWESLAVLQAAEWELSQYHRSHVLCSALHCTGCHTGDPVLWPDILIHYSITYITMLTTSFYRMWIITFHCALHCCMVERIEIVFGRSITWMVDVMVGTMEVDGDVTMVVTWPGLITVGTEGRGEATVLGINIVSGHLCLIIMSSWLWLADWLPSLFWFHYRSNVLFWVFSILLSLVHNNLNYVLFAVVWQLLEMFKFTCRWSTGVWKLSVITIVMW